MKKLMNTAAVILVIYLSGCAVGRKMSYENKEVKPGYTISKNVVTGFQDKREDVLAGKEKPSFCGHMNSTAQIPYNMQTESGKPLAEEFTISITNSLVNQGVKASPLLMKMNTTLDSMAQVVSSAGYERFILFTINKWEANASPRFADIHYEVIYNLDVKIYDGSGLLLAESNVHDNVSKNQDPAVNLKHLQAMADDVFSTQVKALLNNEAVKASLQ